MPRFKGSCGCYNRQDARELGLAPAIVWNDILDRAEHFNTNPMWYDQKDAGERLGIPERSMNRAVDKLVEAGRIAKKKGYRPGTTVSTTWITILEESVGGSRNDDLAVTRNDDLAVPILNDTEERDSQSVSGIVTVIERKKKGETWVDGRRIYTTEEEAEKIESCSRGEYPDFFYWQSRKLVGDESKKKRKCNMPATLLKLEYENPEPTVEVNGKKVKVSYKERLY